MLDNLIQLSFDSSYKLVKKLWKILLLLILDERSVQLAKTVFNRLKQLLEAGLITRETVLETEPSGKIKRKTQAYFIVKWGTTKVLNEESSPCINLKKKAKLTRSKVATEFSRLKHAFRSEKGGRSKETKTLYYDAKYVNPENSFITTTLKFAGSKESDGRWENRGTVKLKAGLIKLEAYESFFRYWVHN